MVDKLTELAAKKGVSNATLAYAWLFHKGVTAPIIGATQAFHIDEALAGAGLALTQEDIAQLEAAYEPHPVIGHV